MTRQFAESWSIHQWLQCFQGGAKSEGLELQKFDDTEAGRDKLVVEERIFDRIILNMPVSVISIRTQELFYISAIMPKVLIEAALLFAGAGAMLRSANDFDLILNTVAATFINELD